MIQSDSADVQFEKKSIAQQFIIIHMWKSYSNGAGLNFFLNIHLRILYLSYKNVEMPSAFQHFYASNIVF